MNSNPYRISAEVRAHREEMQRQAARERLAAEARKGRPKNARFYRALLAGLGARMVDWGKRLQARYDNAFAESAASRPASVTPGAQRYSGCS